MKKLILIFLFFTSLLNAQLLNVLNKGENPELNINTSLDFAYTNLISNSTFTDGTGWDLSSGSSVANGNLILNGAVGSNPFANYTISAQVNQTLVLTYDVIANNLGADGVYIYHTVGYPASVVTSIKTLTKTVGSQTYVFYANGATSTLLPIRALTTTGNISFDNMQLKRLIAPTSFTTPTMSATDYVIESSGCKFIEVTGETYIQMSDTLALGYYKLKVTQDWTQGKLWAYNGTTTYNFPQSDGIYAVKIYLPGNKPLVIGCDNNTISVLSSLSIK